MAECEQEVWFLFDGHKDEHEERDKNSEKEGGDSDNETIGGDTMAEDRSHDERVEREGDKRQHQHTQRRDHIVVGVFQITLHTGGRKFEQVDNHVFQILLEEILDFSSPIKAVPT